MKRIIILGSNGQIGRALMKELGESGVGLRHLDADLTRMGSVISRLEKIDSPLALINAAAYTQVDKAETERELSTAVNETAPGILAHWARGVGIPFVHYSTDYVFSGEGEKPWLEDDATSPVNFYGASKEAGERRVAAEDGKYLIFRTSWVYDAQGKNFLNTILRLAGERDSLKVVNDQIGAPTFAKDIAQATLRALCAALEKKHFPSGIYHLTGAGEASWHEFASCIIETARELGAALQAREIQPIASRDFPTPAARPKNSRLNNRKFKEVFGFELRPWKEALKECMRERLKNENH